MLDKSGSVESALPRGLREIPPPSLVSRADITRRCFYANETATSPIKTAVAATDDLLTTAQTSLTRKAVVHREATDKM